AVSVNQPILKDDSSGARFCADFFFQAEDGIRDSSVTGVQTCALPIYLSANRHRRARADRRIDCDEGARTMAGLARDRRRQQGCRSEERRVGKERRCRRSLGPGYERNDAEDGNEECKGLCATNAEYAVK